MLKINIKDLYNMGVRRDAVVQTRDNNETVVGSIPIRDPHWGVPRQKPGAESRHSLNASKNSETLGVGRVAELTAMLYFDTWAKKWNINFNKYLISQVDIESTTSCVVHNCAPATSGLKKQNKKILVIILNWSKYTF